MPDKDFIIMTESTCDLPRAYAIQHGLAVIPMSYTVDLQEYKGTEGSDLTPQAFYDKIRAGSMPKTSQVTPDEWTQYFKPHLDKGLDILLISFSSALSGTYGSARTAAEELAAQYPEQKIIVIDSKCASLGQGLLVHYALEHRKLGEDIEATAAYVRALAPNICHYFTVDDLHYLHRGGRVSKAAAVIGSMLGVKPVLHVDDEGRLIPIGKVRGRKQSLSTLVDKMAAKTNGVDNRWVFISHGDCAEDAGYVARLVQQKTGISNVLTGDIGPVIGSHSGPGTVALFFIGNGRSED